MYNFCRRKSSLHAKKSQLSAHKAQVLVESRLRVSKPLHSGNPNLRVIARIVFGGKFR